jgi:hypothetical protein
MAFKRSAVRSRLAPSKPFRPSTIQQNSLSLSNNFSLDQDQSKRSVNSGLAARVYLFDGRHDFLCYGAGINQDCIGE